MYRVARRSDRPAVELLWECDFVAKRIGSDDLSKASVIKYLQQHGDAEWLKLWKLSGKFKSINKSRNCRQVVAAYKDFVQCITQGESGGVPDDVFTPSASAAPTPSPQPMQVDEEDDDNAASSDTRDTDNILKLIRILHDLAFNAPVPADQPLPGDEAPPRIQLEGTDFISHKLTNKLRQQTMDPLVLASNALPNWCEELTTTCPVLFPYEARQLFFSSSAFGVSRTIAWIQTQHDASERARQGGVRRPDDGQEFRIGRLTSERVFVPRNEQLLEWAINIMRVHASRKSVLDIEFQDEPVRPSKARGAGGGGRRKERRRRRRRRRKKKKKEDERKREVSSRGQRKINGVAFFLFFAFFFFPPMHLLLPPSLSYLSSLSCFFLLPPPFFFFLFLFLSRFLFLFFFLPLAQGTGLGPTLEFFNLVAAELQRKDLAMWICDDELGSKQEVDLGFGGKPPGFYVNNAGGLFPAPLPATAPVRQRVVEMFRFLGVFVAKSLQVGGLGGGGGGFFPKIL